MMKFNYSYLIYNISVTYQKFFTDKQISSSDKPQIITFFKCIVNKLFIINSLEIKHGYARVKLYLIIFFKIS